MAKEKSNQNKKNKSTGISKGIRFFLSVALIIGLGYVIFNYVPFIAKYNHYVIATKSMEPVIMERDVVIIDTSAELEDLEEDQIIAFYADIFEPGVDEVVVHYLYSVTEEDGVTTYRTYSVEGEGELDPWVLNDDDIIGTFVFKVSHIGGFILFSQSLIGKIVLIADIIIIYVLVEIFTESKDQLAKKAEKKAKTKKKEVAE